MRAARRHRYLREGDWVDSLYKAYITAVIAAAGLFYVSLVVGGDRVGSHPLDVVKARGPGALALVLALAVAVGLRSGAGGGPLAPSAADITHLLLAPIPRGLVLRSEALRQLRGVVTMPTIVGAIAGSVATSRLGGDRAEWIIAGAAFGALAALMVWGAALIASGNHWTRRTATLVAFVLIVWAGIDFAASVGTSPTAQVARVGLLPLSASALAVVGAVLAIATAVLGFFCAANVAIEPLRRRARLLGEIRFAATLQDMRSVIVLHRELAQELPRSKPWIKIRTGGIGNAWWQRDWRGIARWPGGRMARVVLLVALGGLALAGAWRGTVGFVVVAGLALFLAGMDAIEGLAQEVDHRDRSDLLPIPAGDLAFRHLVVPACALLVVGLVGFGVFALATGTSSALAAGAIVILPTAVGAAVGAGTAVVLGAPSPTLLLEYGFPEFTTLWLVIRLLIGPAIVIAAVVPVAVAQHALADGGSAAGAAFQTLFIPIFVVGIALGWLKSRPMLAR